MLLDGEVKYFIPSSVLDFAISSLIFQVSWRLSSHLSSYHYCLIKCSLVFDVSWRSLMLLVSEQKLHQQNNKPVLRPPRVKKPLLDTSLMLITLLHSQGATRLAHQNYRNKHFFSTYWTGHDMLSRNWCPAPSFTLMISLSDLHKHCLLAKPNRVATDSIDQPVLALVQLATVSEIALFCFKTLYWRPCAALTFHEDAYQANQNVSQPWKLTGTAGRWPSSHPAAIRHSRSMRASQLTMQSRPSSWPGLSDSALGSCAWWWGGGTRLML